MPKLNQRILKRVSLELYTYCNAAQNLQVLLIQAFSIEELREIYERILVVEIVVSIRGSRLGVFLLGDEEIRCCVVDRFAGIGRALDSEMGCRGSFDESVAKQYG